MYRQIYDRDRKNPKKLSSSTTLDWGMLPVRPFTMQLKTRSKLPDLKASLSQTERYGHHLDKIQPGAISTGTPIQMFSATEEEEKQRVSGIDLGVSNLTGNKTVLDTVLHIKNRSIKINKSHKKDINTNPNKHFAAQVTNPKETSTSKNKGKEKNSDEHLTSTTKNQVSENKAAEETSLPQDPEVKRLLHEESQNNLPRLGSDTQARNPDKFIAPASTYNADKNTPPPKVGTRGQFLAKKEAMNILGDRKSFAVTQRAVKKVSVGNTAKVENSQAKDNQHQVKLKNAAELVRQQVINDDRQVKEHLRGTFNLNADVVAKEGGEELILQNIS